ncbi:hypothetical protein [Acetivibrio cellulolyticus]|uniref:hypothetical protein n=1 Tax=Acetivibrio cellulolyticus TaxID=35830 RepID=UPI0001E2F108|nr:hypothetical protein [Acetivibrio cellulolyticus]
MGNERGKKGIIYFIIFAVIHFAIMMILTIQTELGMKNYTWDIIPTGGYICYTKGIFIVLLGIGVNFLFITRERGIVKFIIAALIMNFLICPIVLLPIEGAAKAFQIKRLENWKIEGDVKIENQYRKLSSNNVELKSYINLDHIIVDCYGKDQGEYGLYTNDDCSEATLFVKFPSKKNYINNLIPITNVDKNQDFSIYTGVDPQQLKGIKAVFFGSKGDIIITKSDNIQIKEFAFKIENLEDAQYIFNVFTGEDSCLNCKLLQKYNKEKSQEVIEKIPYNTRDGLPTELIIDKKTGDLYIVNSLKSGNIFFVNTVITNDWFEYRSKIFNDKWEEFQTHDLSTYKRIFDEKDRKIYVTVKVESKATQIKYEIHLTDSGQLSAEKIGE